jgi:hypothetical protein
VVDITIGSMRAFHQVAAEETLEGVTQLLEWNGRCIEWITTASAAATICAASAASAVRRGVVTAAMLAYQREPE